MNLVKIGAKLEQQWTRFVRRSCKSVRKIETENFQKITKNSPGFADLLVKFSDIKSHFSNFGAMKISHKFDAELCWFKKNEIKMFTNSLTEFEWIRADLVAMFCTWPGVPSSSGDYSAGSSCGLSSSLNDKRPDKRAEAANISPLPAQLSESGNGRRS